MKERTKKIISWQTNVFKTFEVWNLWEAMLQGFKTLYNISFIQWKKIKILNNARKNYKDILYQVIAEDALAIFELIWDFDFCLKSNRPSLSFWKWLLYKINNSMSLLCCSSSIKEYNKRVSAPDHSHCHCTNLLLSLAKTHCHVSLSFFISVVCLVRSKLKLLGWCFPNGLPHPKHEQSLLLWQDWTDVDRATMLNEHTSIIY